MASTRTRRLAAAATLVESILAGANVNRAAVEMPAWQQTGPLAWAAFSRHADLARRAAILYPLSAVVGLLLSAAAVVSYRREGGTPRAAAIPLHGAALMGAAGLLTTSKAAPHMLRVRHLGADAAALQQALDGFQFWGNVRGLFQVLAFVGNVWSLVAITEPATRGPAPEGRAR
jgi:hypothetical protein